MLEKYLLELATLIGLSQVEIAASLGVNRSAVHRWLHGTQPTPDAQRIGLVAAVVRTAELFASFYEYANSNDSYPKKWASEKAATVPRVRELMALCALE